MGGLLNRVPLAAGAAVLAAALIALVVVLVTGGDDKPSIPAGAVAVVGDKPITTASLSHWQSVYSNAAKASNASTTDAQARKAAFALVAGFTWIEQEAQRQHVQVSSAQVNTAVRAFFDQYQGASREQILSQMGASEADLRTQQRVSLLANALQDRAAKKAPAPSSQQIKDTYDREPQRWAHPSKRDLRLVITSSQKDAQAARSALAQGKSFSAVNQRYAAGSQLASQGGAIKGLAPGTTDPALERAVFRAALHQLVGPIRTGTGWVVFKVQKITPLADRTLAQATKAIRAELTGTAQGKAVSAYLDDMRDYWRHRTACTDAVAVKDYCGA